jgi:hypothetical protein
LTVYEDGLCGGQWFSCATADCRVAGDMLELAALAWGCQAQTALVRLAQLGLGVLEEALQPEALARYGDCFIERRRRLNALWNEARERLAHDAAIGVNQLRSQFYLFRYISQERWSQGPGRLFGALPCGQVEAHFCPQSVAEYGRNRVTPYNPSQRRVFRGRGWQEVLTVAYHDLPGRICGCYFVGRNGTVADRLYRPTLDQRATTCRGQRPEAGLAGLETMDASQSWFAHHVLAIEDPILALRLQVRHAGISLEPLPIVSWYDGPTALTKDSWRVLDGKAVLFCAWPLTPRVLYQAMQANGYLCLAGPADTDSASLLHYLRQALPMDMFRHFMRHARPWRQALRHWAKNQADGTVLDLLAGMRAYGISMDQLARYCGGRRRAHRLLPPATPVRTAMVNGMTIRERLDGWFVSRGARPEVQLSNVIVRLDEHYQGEHDRSRYRGRLLYQGKEIPFDISARWFSQNAVNCLKRVATAAGIPFVWRSGQRVPLISVAQAFHALHENKVAYQAAPA